MAHVGARRRLGRTEVEVTELGFGGASIGELFVRVSDRDAQATLAAAWDAGVRYFDTAPWYGRGLSELRTGAALRDHPRAEFALSTKVGRWLQPSKTEDFDGAPWAGGSPNAVVFDYTYDGIMRSVEGSRLRLGITRFDMAVIHDLDRWYFDEPTMEAHLADLASSGWRAL
jgi:D-threo-aldose 1-dehydrogenase